NDQASFLPQSAESTRVAEQLPGFNADATLPLILTVEGEGGLSPAALGELQSWAKQLPEQSAEGVPGTVADYLTAPKVPVIPSEDGEAAIAVVSLDAQAVEETVDETSISNLLVEDLRADLGPQVDGATVAVTGP